MDVDLLANLNPQQREAVLHFDSPLLIVAGAGSGKTRVITHKIAYLVLQQQVLPYHILGVTFTNRAADEMKNRIEGLTGIENRLFHVSTFHSFGLRLLREAGAAAGFGPEWKVGDDDEQKRSIERIAKAQFPHFTSDMREGITRKISLAKMNLIYPNNPEPLRQLSWEEDEVALYAAYHEYQKQNRLWDYEDLISLPVRLLQSDERIARKYREKYRHILIDEFQDINPNQYALIKLIAADCRNITAVGDDDQAIYSWRGASIRFLFDYERDFPGTKVIKLEQNYRSSKNILSLANHLIAFNFNRKGKSMWSEWETGYRVFFLRSYSKDDEAEKIARLVSELKECKPELFPLAVLYRINSQSLPLETAFLKHKLPFKIIKGLRFFDRKEIKDSIALLRLVFNPDDDLAFLRLIDFLPLGIGDRTLSALTQYARAQGCSLLRSLQQALPEKFSQQPLFSRILANHELQQAKSQAAMLREMLEESGYLKTLAQKEENERLLNIDEFIEFIDKWQKENPSETFIDLLDRMSLQLSGKNDDASEKVFFLTMHNAKGLEFQSVIAVGINSAYMPFFLRQERAEIEEERRLFYVACTRAMKLLLISSGSERNSPFMLSLAPDLYTKVADIAAIVNEVVGEDVVAPHEDAAKYLLHPIFGRGKILETISQQKLLVHFNERGSKIIDTSMVSVEFL